MKVQMEQIVVPGQKTGPASFHEYILDPVSVEPERKRPAVIVCPGGGYAYCSKRESEPVVTQFLAMGCHCFWLDYSVAPENIFPTALWEAAKAVSIVRGRCAEWRVDPGQIYLCGFSAGGHLACSLGVFWNRAFVWDALGLAAEQVRPDGLILGYPVISGGAFTHKKSLRNLLGEDGLSMTAAEYFREKTEWMGTDAGAVWKEPGAPDGTVASSAGEPAGSGTACGAGPGESAAPAAQNDLPMEEFVSLELQVSPAMPKTFLWHTFEDGAVPVENSLMLASAIRQNGVNLELHIFPKGKHGLSLANEETSVPGGAQNVPAVQAWVPLVRAWIGEWRERP